MKSLILLTISLCHQNYGDNLSIFQISLAQNDSLTDIYCSIPNLLSFSCKLVLNCLSLISDIQPPENNLSDRVLRLRRPEAAEVNVPSLFSKFDVVDPISKSDFVNPISMCDFVNPISMCDDNYSSEEELKEIINCDRQRKKSGASLVGGGGALPAPLEGADSNLTVDETRTAPSSRSSTGSSLGIEESASSRSGPGGQGAPAEKRKWSEMSACHLCASDAERASSSGPCSCDEVSLLKIVVS